MKRSKQYHGSTKVVDTDVQVDYNFYIQGPSGEQLPPVETAINFAITSEQADTNKISDGYHTFGELYDHRINIFIALCKSIHYLSSSNKARKPELDKVWRSKNHSDGEPAFGGSWFVLGIGVESGQQITYHLPIIDWDRTYFAETLEKAPEFDGHTSADVLGRIANL